MLLLILSAIVAAAHASTTPVTMDDVQNILAVRWTAVPLQLLFYYFLYGCEFKYLEEFCIYCIVGFACDKSSCASL